MKKSRQRYRTSRFATNRITTRLRCNSPVFRLGESAQESGIRAIAWFDDKSPLRSGWAWGQHYLEGGVAAIEAQLGKGKVFLFGPEILKRSQPHGTFKFLFNGIYE